MSIAARFETTLADVSAAESSAPELLPVRLSQAAARMLPVDGAGLSVAASTGERIPLGGSSPDAEQAERLQFTVGDGPCWASQTSGEPVFAMLEDLHRRWPPFADQLVRRTPYRAVVALPLPTAVFGRGAVDFYFREETAVAALDVFEAMAVGDLITSALSEASVMSSWRAEHGPDWLHGPAPTGRAAVWEALGKVSLALDVDQPVALALMRAAAWSADRTVDDVAADLLTARMSAEELAGADDAGARGS